MNSTRGTIIVLNGPSSAGKTFLLNAIQDVLPAPFLDAGLDKFLWMLPPRYRRVPLWNEVLGQATRSGPEGHRLVQGMHNAIAALSRSGSNVIADHVLVESAWSDVDTWRRMSSKFHGPSHWQRHAPPNGTQPSMDRETGRLNRSHLV